MSAPKTTNAPLVAYTLDFETGGLDCQTCACTQIAIHATRLDTFERIGSFVRYIAPYDRKEIKGVGTGKKKVLQTKYEAAEKTPMLYQEQALEVSGITMDLLHDKGEELSVVAQGVVDFLATYTPDVSKGQKPFLIGQNIEFDKGFFMQMMEYAGLVTQVKKYLRGTVDFYGRWQPLVLDTIILGQLALCHLPQMDTYKLEIMCEKLGIELDDAHDADADVTATTNVVAVLTQRMRNIADNGDEGQLTISKTEKSRKHFKI